MQEIAKEQVYLTGTIIACPSDDCGHGLYKVVETASFADLVIFDDIKLVRINDAIPPHDVWKRLACPLCEARLLKDGKVHTLQYGWK